MVMESFSYIETYQSIQIAAKERLAAIENQFSQRLAFTTELRIGHAFAEAAKAAVEYEADLVLKVAKTDLLDRLFGSDDMRLLRKCPAPVWLVHPGDSVAYKRIVAAVDVNYHYPDAELKIRKQLNESVVIQAAQIAVQERATLQLIHVMDMHVDMVIYDGIVDVASSPYSQDEQEVEHEREQAMQALVDLIVAANPDNVIADLDIQTSVHRGMPRRDIPKIVKDLSADVLVMGTVARVGVPGFFMGNTAESIINLVSCSILAIKPHGFVSPLIT
jgi:nucleotide-binding universal stress UspA family protein